MLEGPPGTGKSTLLRAVAAAAGLGVELVEGHAELTPARLLGAHDPAEVLQRGYAEAAFVPGPLVRALRNGAVLYVEELNRVPEETLNVLITALAEGEVNVPRLGTVRAAPTFRLVAAMNPFDTIGTARVSQAIADRLCRVLIGYQDAAGEEAIVARQADSDGSLAAAAVRVVRASREHPDLRHGASVRGAIDLVVLATALADGRGVAAQDRACVRDAAHAALSGRIRVEDGCDRTPEAIVDELLAAVWEGQPPGEARPGERRAPPPG